MDSLGENLHDPLRWAADTVVSGIIEFGDKGSLSDVENLFYQSKEFLVAAFEEEDIPLPDDAEIIRAAEWRLEQYLLDQSFEDDETT